MTYRPIALIGRARSGKDSVAARLIGRHAYMRVTLADPVRRVALDLDPIITAGDDGTPVRLAELVAAHGWERAKSEHPEVRRTLQALGEGVRRQDPEVWLRLALDLVKVADYWHLPTVVTDARYRNEAEALRGAGFRLVRIVRPGHLGAESEAAREHVSETELDGADVDQVVINDGTLADLARLADQLVIPL